MRVRSCIRKIRRAAFARRCATLLVVLALCPLTAPFATYSLTGTPIGVFLVQDASVDIAPDTDVPAGADLTAALACSQPAGGATIVHPSAAVAVARLRLVVLRV
jgi:hypothetical protein